MKLRLICGGIVGIAAVCIAGFGSSGTGYTQVSDREASQLWGGEDCTATFQIQADACTNPSGEDCVAQTCNVQVDPNNGAHMGIHPSTCGGTCGSYWQKTFRCGGT